MSKVYSTEGLLPQHKIEEVYYHDQDRHTYKYPRDSRIMLSHDGTKHICRRQYCNHRAGKWELPKQIKGKMFSMARVLMHERGQPYFGIMRIGMPTYQEDGQVPDAEK